MHVDTGKVTCCSDYMTRIHVMDQILNLYVQQPHIITRSVGSACGLRKILLRDSKDIIFNYSRVKWNRRRTLVSAGRTGYSGCCSVSNVSTAQWCSGGHYHGRVSSQHPKPADVPQYKHRISAEHRSNSRTAHKFCEDRWKKARHTHVVFA